MGGALVAPAASEPSSAAASACCICARRMPSRSGGQAVFICTGTGA